MTPVEIQQKVTAIFRDVFDDPALEISDATTAKDVPGWDSITHVNLIVAVEKGFKIAFTTREVMALESVGDLLRLIARRAA